MRDTSISTAGAGVVPIVNTIIKLADDHNTIITAMTLQRLLYLVARSYQRQTGTTLSLSYSSAVDMGQCS